MKTEARKILLNQVREMMKNFDIDGVLDINVTNALESGAIDSESINEKDSTIAKCIFHLTLKNAANQYIPVSDMGKKELKNLQYFI